MQIAGIPLPLTLEIVHALPAGADAHRIPGTVSLVRPACHLVRGARRVGKMTSDSRLFCYSHRHFPLIATIQRSTFQACNVTVRQTESPDRRSSP